MPVSEPSAGRLAWLVGRSHALSATTSRTLRAVCRGHSLDSIHGDAWKVAGVNILKIIQLLGLNVSKHNGDKQWPVFL